MVALLRFSPAASSCSNHTPGCAGTSFWRMYRRWIPSPLLVTRRPNSAVGSMLMWLAKFCAKSNMSPRVSTARPAVEMNRSIPGPEDEKTNVGMPWKLSGFVISNTVEGAVERFICRGNSCKNTVAGHHFPAVNRCICSINESMDNPVCSGSSVSIPTETTEPNEAVISSSSGIPCKSNS